MNELIKLEDIKKYSLNNGKYWEFIKLKQIIINILIFH